MSAARKDLLLVGGGHSHVEVLRRLAMAPVDGLRVTLVSRELRTPYSGMLPGLISGHYAWDDAHIDLGPLCAAAGVRLVGAEVESLNLARNCVSLPGRPALRFDLLSINCGAVPVLSGIDGADEIGIPVKPIGRFWPRWQQLLQRWLEEPDLPRRLCVVGGGAGGVELALAAHHRLVTLAGLSQAQVCLISAAEHLLPEHNARARRLLARALASRGVEVITGARVEAARDGALNLAGGGVQAADEILWVTQAGPPAWPGGAGLGVNADGFILVDESLRSLSHPQVFAAGDVAWMDRHPRPRAGVFAVRQGPVLADNLRCVAEDRAPRPFVPQQQFLSLISTGDKQAVASRGSLAWGGAWLWRWKDHIDRRFMRRYQVSSTPMAGDELASEGTMYCGGCGSKLGAELLDAVLRRLASETGAFDPDMLFDDAALVAPGDGALQVHSMDGFRAMIDDPWQFGRIAAEHALNDIHAMGASPTSAMLWAGVRHAAPQLMAEELYQLTAGVISALQRCGARLIGGHSSEGDEMFAGLAVSGSLAGREPWLKSGLRADDMLLLTKPLGSGTLLAAQMRKRCQARWLASAIEVMALSNAAAVPVLREHGVKACTDVTGFGLLGHLIEMLDASSVSVAIQAAAVPALDGALDCLRAGVSSSLAPANERALGRVDASSAPTEPALLRLLCDPQTSGGLLAGVPAERAQACITALHAAGYRQAAIIGQVTTTPNSGDSILISNAPPGV